MRKAPTSQKNGIQRSIGLVYTIRACAYAIILIILIMLKIIALIFSKLAFRIKNNSQNS